MHARSGFRLGTNGAVPAKLREKTYHSGSRIFPIRSSDRRASNGWLGSRVVLGFFVVFIPMLRPVADERYLVG